jgi:hypothetical protein
MRQIGTAEQEKERNQRNIKYFSIGLLAILVFSTLGFAFFSNPSDTAKNRQNNTAVQQISDNQWAFIFGEQQIVLTTSPEQAKNVTFLSAPSLAEFSQKKVYVDGTDTIFALVYNTLTPYASKVQPGCYGNCSKDLPELDCNSTLIVYKQNDERSISTQDGCTFIEGDKQSVDAFIYKIAGMI